MDISWSFHHKESCLKLRYEYIMECLSQGKMFKLVVCIYHQVFIARKVFQSCGLYISSSVHRKESCLKVRYVYIIKCSAQEKLFKVSVCIYHGVHVYLKESRLKLQYAYIIKCSSQGNLF